MKTNHHKAFTLVELIFAIVIIGILSAIAVPKFITTSEMGYLSKAQSVATNLMASMATERQKRVLKGNFDSIEDLGDSTYVFNKYKNGDHNDVLSSPMKNCSASQRACWERIDATHYVYKFVNASDGEAKFKIDKNKFVCDSDEADCNKIIR